MVVGNQSSGKSSLLQAITRLPFPADDGQCTRFPIEVSLQRCPTEEEASVSFEIAVDADFAARADIANTHLQRMLAWQPRNFSKSDKLIPQKFRDIIDDVSLLGLRAALF